MSERVLTGEQVEQIKGVLSMIEGELTGKSKESEQPATFDSHKVLEKFSLITEFLGGDYNPS